MFVTIEGGEGSGKTTVINQLRGVLQSKGHRVMITREPGGVRIAEKIREIILDCSHTEMDGRTEALLYAAARRQHLVEKVIPALDEGKVVISDRFIESSLAYQGYSRGIGIDEVYSINKFAIDTYMPDLTIYLEIDPKLGLERIDAHDGREVNRLDLEHLDFHYKVQEGYNEVIKRYPDRIVKVDASQSVDDVVAKCVDLILSRI